MREAEPALDVIGSRVVEGAVLRLRFTNSKQDVSGVLLLATLSSLDAMNKANCIDTRPHPHCNAAIALSVKRELTCKIQRKEAS